MAKGRHIPERSCVACGRKMPKRELIRVLRTPDGTVRVDPTGKGAGRGAYLCRSSDCWQRGMGKGGLERSFKSTLSSRDREELWAFFREAAARPSSEAQ